MARKAGRAPDARRGGFEALEGRVLMAGDHPSFSNFPTADAVTLDGVTGAGSIAGEIEVGLELNDLFKFTVPVGGSDFVTIRADAQNSGQTLNSRLDIYTNNNGSPVLVASSSGDGVLTAGTPTDAWIGFVAQENTEYFVKVSGDVQFGPGATGTYVLRIDRITDKVAVKNAVVTDSLNGIIHPTADSPIQTNPVLGAITLPGGDKVYAFTVPTGHPEYDGIISFNIAATSTNLSARLDTRLDVFDGTGQALAVSSAPGRLNDAFSWAKSTQGKTYYVRVRSDEFLTSRAAFATGGYVVNVDVGPKDFNPLIDTGTHRAQDLVANFPVQFQSNLYRFVAQSTGTTIISAIPAGLFPVLDPALRIIDENGTLLAFNNDFAGASPQIVVNLTGGKTYYIIVDGFDQANTGLTQYSLFVESSTTFNTNSGQTADDHPNTPPLNQTADSRRTFEASTPLVWGSPFLLKDSAGNFIQDSGWLATAVGTGRIHQTGDSDLFSFVPPADQQGTYTGSNDDNGSSLYVGGSFQNAGTVTTAVPNAVKGIAAWDAGDFWAARLGLNGNVFAMAVYTAPGTTQPILFVGGDFTTATNGPLPADVITVNHLAAYLFDPARGDYFWFAIPNNTFTTGAVRAMAVVDLPDTDGAGPGQDLPPVLMIGGDFGNLVQWNGANLSNVVAVSRTGGNPRVLAITQYIEDLADPDGDAGPLADPAPTVALAIGGDFTGVTGATTPKNIAKFGSNYNATNPIFTWQSLGSGASNGVTGVVRALAPFDPPDPDGNDPANADPPPGLIVGGTFTVGADNCSGPTANPNGGNAPTLNNVAYWDGGIQSGSTGAGTYLLSGWRQMKTGGNIGVNGAVNALTAWDPADPDGAGGYPDLPEFIVAGGAFTTAGGAPAGSVAAYDFNQLPANQAWLPLGPLGGITGGVVNSLLVMSDQDVGITEDPILYAGGSFTGADTQVTNRIARFVYNAGLGDFLWGPMAAGPAATPNGTNPFPTENGVGVNATVAAPGIGTIQPAAVFALVNFDDGNAAFWDRHDRPSARVNIVVAPDFEGFANTQIRIYDSNFTLIYSNTNMDTTPWSSQLGIASTFPFDTGRSGGLDPSRALPGSTFNALPPMWAGERYYLEVSIDTGVGVGRYTVSVTADAKNVFDSSPNSSNSSPAQAGDFGNAFFLGTSPSTGDATDYVPPTNQAPIVQVLKGGASSQSVAYLTEYGNIYDLNETDLYYFRAEADGFAEIRLNTLQMNGEFTQFIGNDQTTLTKSFQSPLDGALRIFDGDFTQIAYANDYPGVSGDPGNPLNVGTLGAFSFTRRDPTMVFPVIEGEFYYIQVENGQKWVDGAPADAGQRTARLPEDVDWRHASGAYQLLLNSMPDLDPATDDHGDTPATATPLPISYDQTSPSTNGRGSAVGTINTTLDVDALFFITPARGVATVTVNRAVGSLVLPDVEIFDSNLALVVSGTASSNGSLSLQFPVSPGEQYYIRIVGSGSSTGGYNVAVSGMPYADLVADSNDIPHVPAMVQFDFLGSGEANGALEQPGDTDLYKFTTTDYQIMTLRVESLSAQTLNPYITIYEVNVDAVGHPVLQRIAFNDDVAVGDRTAVASFSATPARVYTPTGQSFPYYFVAVSGSDPNTDYGVYKLKLSFPPTDDHPDAGEYAYADSITIDSAIGTGSINARTENFADSDLFQFTAPAGGQAKVVVTRPVGSSAIPKVSIIQFINGAPVVLGTGTATEVGQVFTPADTGLVNVTRNQIYYVLVENTGARFGQYTVSVTAPAVDDYPNAGEFTIASQVPLSSLTGDGSVGTGVVGDPLNPHLSPDTDTDLFFFIPVKDGPVSVSIISYNAATERFAPRLRVFDNTGTLLPAGDVSTNVLPTSNTPSVVTFSFPDGLQGQKYYVLVSAVAGLAPPATLTGEYRLDINTTSGTGGGDPGAIDFDHPDGTVVLDTRTGDGQVTDLVNVPGDRDLFVFTIPANVNPLAPVFIQVVTPSGSILDAGLTILNAPNEQAVVTADSAGFPGNTAAAQFSGAPGTYYAIVGGVGTGTGAYTLRINSEPKKQYLYFPEGYASPTISEFISISNNNAFDVTYSVIAYYEDVNDATPPTVIYNNLTIAAGSRGGVTTSKPGGGAFSGMVQFRPYTLVIESNAPLGATMAHYDFGSTIGDALTEKLSATWTFGRVEKNPGAVEDYVLYFNPNPFTVTVDIVAYTSIGAIPIVLPTVNGHNLNELPANRRFGLSIKDLPQLPVEVMGLTLTAHAKDSANNAAFASSGIVASLSHYDLVNGAGYGFIGDAQGGANLGVSASITNSATITGEITLFNSSSATASVTLTRTYVNPGFPSLSTNLTIPAHKTVVLKGTSGNNALQLVDSQPAGITYTSNVPIVMTTSQTQLGDSDATAAATAASTHLLLSGDGYINTPHAGSLYFETVSLYNPTNQATVITVKLLFNGTNDYVTLTRTVAAHSFAQIKLHEEPQVIVDRTGELKFSIEASATVPIVATLTHYDLYLGGGWTSGGVPLGLTNDLTSIPA